jgi:prepilin-type N-terminal cleavage/methylation domain-containing protein
LVLRVNNRQLSLAPQEFVVTEGIRGSRGFSLVELMIAMVVLAVGLLAAAGLICSAMATNLVPKLGSTSATLAESTMESIMAIPQDATGAAASTSLTDCSGNTFIVNTVVGGSPLTSGSSQVAVDFQQPAVPGYSMQYVNCASDQSITYDVRWTVESGPTPSTQLITVSARVLPGGAGRQGVYAQATTLRTLRGGS